jgi:hypothetical protein
LLFLGDGMCAPREEIDASVDFICAGEHPVSVDLPLGVASSESAPIIIIVSIGPRSTPRRLRYNGDVRELGVQILAVQNLTEAGAKIPR